MVAGNNRMAIHKRTVHIWIVSQECPFSTLFLACRLYKGSPVWQAEELILMGLKSMPGFRETFLNQMIIRLYLKDKEGIMRNVLLNLVAVLLVFSVQGPLGGGGEE